MAEARRLLKDVKEKYPHKYEILIKAMEKSGGAVDNSITEALLNTNDDVFTVELLCNVAKGIEESAELDGYVRNVYRERFWEKGLHKKMSSSDKEVREDGKHKYKFEDTFLFKAVKRAGFKSNPLNEYGKDREYDTRTNTSREMRVRNRWGVCCIADGKHHYRRDVVEPVSMFFLLKKSSREFVVSDEVWEKYWFTFGQYQTNYVPTYNVDPDWLTEEECDKKCKEYIIKELDWIANAPEELVNKMKEKLQECINRRRNVNQYTTSLWAAVERKGSKVYDPKNYLLYDEAYAIMDYLGIGVMVKPELIDEYWHDFTYGVKKIYRKMAGSLKRFKADVKKGFDIKDARELLVEDLNTFSNKSLKGQWLFFERTDAPEEYPDIPTKKKKIEKKEEEQEQEGE